MDSKENLKKIIKESQLSLEDKKEWERLVSEAPESFIEVVSDALENYPEEIEWFNSMYKRKKEAYHLSQKDPEKGKQMLGEIFEEEKEKLQQLSN